MNIHNCLDDIRPKAFCLDAQPADGTTPDVLRTGGLERYSEFQIETGNKLQSQWESKYFSQILPFVFPRMCSGPDFAPEKHKWHRSDDSAVVTPMEFTKAIARRIEGQIRHDFTAVPIIRSVCYKWMVEHS